MQFNRERDPHSYTIHGVGSDGITIIPPMTEGAPPALITFNRSFALTPHHLIEPWGPATAGEIELHHILELLRHDPELVLLGTGARLRFPTREITTAVWAEGIGLECMDNAAAARTYNILMGEGRAVLAAFLQDD